MWHLQNSIQYKRGQRLTLRSTSRLAMMVPDYGLIAENSLFSFGFSEAKTIIEKNCSNL